MRLRLKNSIKDPQYIQKLVNERLNRSLETMAKEIHDKANELEPPQHVKESYFSRIKKLLK